MSTNSPSTPARIATVNIEDLPGIRRYVAAWRNTIFANSAARREAKGVLFAELSEATRRNMPLDVALELASRSTGELLRSTAKKEYGADNRASFVQGIFAIVYMLLLKFGYTLYLPFAFRMVDTERIARILSRLLLVHVRAGMAFHEAMWRCSRDFSTQEIQIARRGEEAGRLPDALQILADFQMTESRLSIQNAQLVYPLVTWQVILTIVAFAYVYVVPKFSDIYAQLGVELPLLTRYFGGADSNAWLPLIGLGTFFTVTFILLRALMNGTRMSQILFLLPLLGFPFFTWQLIALTPQSSSIRFALVMLFGIPIDDAPHIFFPLLFLVLALVLIIGYFPIMRLAERIVLWIERSAARPVRHLPIVGKAARAQAEAMWLAMLSMSLKAGSTAPDALAHAGEICGGGIKQRSEVAAHLVRGGVPIGRACIEARVLASHNNYRLDMVDWRGDFLKGLHMIAQDAANEANETMARTGRLCEVVATVLTPAAVFFFITAMYLPLFSIPGAVMRR